MQFHVDFLKLWKTYFDFPLTGSPKFNISCLLSHRLSSAAKSYLNAVQSIASNIILDTFILCVLQRYPAEACKQMSLKLQFWFDSRCHTISTKLHFVVINLRQRSVPLKWSVIPWGRGTVELGKGWCVRLYPFEWKEKCLWAHEASECNTWVSSGECRWS